MTIPVSQPLFISNEKKYLDNCIESGWISSEGPYVKEFEKKFARYVGMKYGISVSSGTAALEVALGALNVKPGDEIIMPAFTIISCALAALAYGATPVFVDCERETWNIDPAQIESKITKKTKAIMAVHIYGHPAPMDPIQAIARRHKIPIVEDAAEAHGAEYKGRKAGSLGDISCFSFYANKIITTGEGGMILTNNKRHAKTAQQLRNLGFDPKRRFYHRKLARNYRMTNLQAAVGVAQLKNINTLVRIKRTNAKLYTRLLNGTKGITLPIEKAWAKNVYWMYGIILDKSTGYTAAAFAEKLKKRGIETRPFFYPLHLQPILKQYISTSKNSHPISEYIAKQGLYLPSGLALTPAQITYITNSVRALVS